MDPKEYRLAAIMFTDIVGFSRMMEENEKATLKLLEYHNEIVQKHTEELRGSVIKTIGDAFLIDFPNTVNAVNCAVRIQQDLEERNRNNPEFTLVLRIGVHLGDIYFYENDALGEGINIASRLESICNPGRICISQDVFNLVNNKIDDIPIKELGAVKLKNIKREIRAYEILTNGKGEAPAEESAETASPESEEIKEAAEKIESARAGTAAEAEVDLNELKHLVMGEIKRAGRRLSVDQMRAIIPGNSPKVDEFLQDMVKKGFLSPAAPGAQEGIRTGASASGEGSGVDPKDFPYNVRRAAREIGSVGKEIVHEIGREFERGRRSAREQDYRNRYRIDQGGREQYLPIPDRRGYGEDDKQDKMVEKAWDRVLDTPYDSWQDQQLIQEYRAQTMKSLQKMESGFRGHLGSYIAVNGGLFAIWLFTSGLGSFPWFFFPAAGWGIGMVSHIAALRQKRNEARQLQSLPALNKQQLKRLRKLNKNRSSFIGQLVSTVATSAFLAGINLITSPFVPWSLIPIAAMSIGVFSRLPSFKHKENELLGELSKMGVPVKQLKNTKKVKLSSAAMSLPSGSMSPMEAEAQNLKAAVLAQIAGMRDRSQLGEDFESVLDNYVNQVMELSRKDQEINRTLEAVPMVNLERELLDLQKQKDGTGNPDLIVELEKSIESIKKQQSSYYELQNQQQMLKVKITSAINSLRQLQLDLVRMKRAPEIGELPPVDSLRTQTGEINHYLSDLEIEYRRLESMEEDLKQ
jgi:class 3 adenylate cyclase